MAIITPNEPGVASLKKFASDLRESGENIRNEVRNLQNVVDQYQAKLGPHADSIKNCIEVIQGEVNKSIEPTNSLAESLDSLANDYQEFIDDDIFAGIGGGK